MEKWYEKFYSIALQPDVRTFNTIINSYGKQCLFEKMTTVMENMQKCYFSWTTVTYKTVIDAYGRVGEIEKTTQLTVAYERRKPGRLRDL